MIYHITDPETWQLALQTGFYVHPSLKSEGVIYASKERQVMDVVETEEKFSHADELVILHIVERRIKDKVSYVEENGVLQPRIHGRIPLDAIEEVSVIPRLDDGTFNWDAF